MTRLALGAVTRQVLRPGSGFGALVLATALGFTVAVLAFAASARFVEHASEMSAVPPEARLTITAGARGRELDDLAKIRAAAGVLAAAWFEALPGSVWWRPELFERRGQTAVGWVVPAGEGVEDTLGLTRVSGRWLAADDADRIPVPVVVSRSFLSDAGGAGRLRSVQRDVEVEVVGVVEDFLSHGHMRTSRSSVIWPVRPAPHAVALYQARVAEADVGRAARAIEAALALGPTRYVKVEETRATFAAMQRSAAQAAGALEILVAMVAVTVLLASVAVAAFRVVERRQQHAVLRALGATPLDLAATVIAEGAIASAIGVGIGLLVSASLQVALRSLIPHFALRGPWIAAAAAIFVGSGAIASVVPALRSAKVPPSAAGRSVA